MKPWILTTLFALITVTCTSQSFRKKDHSFTAGITSGAYESNIQLASDVQLGEIAVAGFTLCYEYNLLKEVGFGLGYRQRWLFGSDTLVKKSSPFPAIFVSNILHMINKDKFNLSLGLHYGPAWLRYHFREDSDFIDVKANGFNYITDLRISYFPSHRAGVNINLGLASYPLDLNSYEINGVDRVEEKGDYNISFTGFELNIGVVFRVGREELQQ